MFTVGWDALDQSTPNWSPVKWICRWRWRASYAQQKHSTWAMWLESRNWRPFRWQSGRNMCVPHVSHCKGVSFERFCWWAGASARRPMHRCFQLEATCLVQHPCANLSGAVALRTGGFGRGSSWEELAWCREKMIYTYLHILGCKAGKLRVAIDLHVCFSQVLPQVSSEAGHLQAPSKNGALKRLQSFLAQTNREPFCNS